MPCEGWKNQLVTFFIIFVFSAIFLAYNVRTWKMNVLSFDEIPSYSSRVDNAPQKYTKHNGSRHQVYEDLNCVDTIPEFLHDEKNNMPIIIPDDLNLPLDILACLYHRYVTTIQTSCMEPKLMGLADEKGGYVCVDGDYLPTGHCNAYIFGSAVNKLYTDQLKSQYNCTFNVTNDENKLQDRTGKSSNLFRSLRRWMPKLINDNKDVNLLVLTITENPNDVYIVNELLLTHTLMSKVRQITIKIYFKAETASSIGYEERLLIFRKLYQLHFRIFFFNQEVECKPPSIFLSKFLSCYSVYLMKPHTDHTPQIVFPQEGELNRLDKLDKMRFYDRWLSSLQVSCHHIIRIGNIKSGGWNVCHDRQYRPYYPCLVYSFGINTDWTFEEDISKTYGCDVFSFDPSINRKNYQHSNKVTFYNLGIAGSDTKRKHWTLRTLGSILRMLHHSKRVLDIVKMDVEGDEWGALQTMIRTGTLRQIRQLYLEFHFGPNLDRLLIIKKLDELGFKIFWTHKNLASSCKAKLDGGFSTTCFEVYFINVRFQES